MLRARGGADLAEEALTAERGTKVGVQHLDGDVAVVLQVMCKVTVAIPPAPSSRSRR